MSKLVYSTITSLDGYMADDNDNIDWGAPDPEVHTVINELGRVDRFRGGVVHLQYRIRR